MVVVDRSLTPPGVEIHQVLAGREVANGADPLSEAAGQMANYMYVVIDASPAGRNAVLIDPCWDVDGLMKYCHDQLGVKTVSRAVFTHRHFDHTGGLLPKMFTGGREVMLPGLHCFVERGVPVSVGQDDVEATAKQSGVAAQAIEALRDGDSVQVCAEGASTLSVLHTPGHTPGSICFLLKPREGPGPSVIFTGDTLFIGSCGRSDLPESNPTALLASLDRLSQLPEDVCVFPGHNYARPAHSTIGAERAMNGMMVQAMARAKQRMVLPGTVAASLRLPDYLDVCHRLVKRLAADTSCHDAHQCPGFSCVML
eukprot:TRINITY_DN18374_c0_g1_i3.p1 TRINITY_DN18374_c0_g1~~TRINITY_DN18374_c0_g1_i3.p1  ORF type:complete len:312 (-),score=35.22 TRINITY_DN18374_c0_g1_i3:35-970(-)